MHKSDMLIMKDTTGESIVLWGLFIATWQIICDVNPFSRTEHPSRMEGTLVLKGLNC